jgi:hypothetical protein
MKKFEVTIPKRISFRELQIHIVEAENEEQALEFAREFKGEVEYDNEGDYEDDYEYEDEIEIKEEII